MSFIYVAATVTRTTTTRRSVQPCFRITLTPLKTASLTSWAAHPYYAEKDAQKVAADHTPLPLSIITMNMPPVLQDSGVEACRQGLYVYGTTLQNFSVKAKEPMVATFSMRMEDNPIYDAADEYRARFRSSRLRPQCVINILAEDQADLAETFAGTATMLPLKVLDIGGERTAKIIREADYNKEDTSNSPWDNFDIAEGDPSRLFDWRSARPPTLKGAGKVYQCEIVRVEKVLSKLPLRERYAYVAQGREACDGNADVDKSPGEIGAPRDMWLFTVRAKSEETGV